MEVVFYFSKFKNFKFCYKCATIMFEYNYVVWTWCVSLPPNCISIVWHVKPVVHGNSTFPSRVIPISRGCPPGMKPLPRGSTWIFLPSTTMVLLMVTNTNHIRYSSCIRLNKSKKLLPNVSLQNMYNNI